MAKQTFTTGQVLTAAQMTSLQQTAMGGGSATAKTANYTLVAADAGTTVIMNSASTTTITVNTALFSAGDTVLIVNQGAGVCTVTAGTATVSTAGSLALSQYETGILYFLSSSAAIFSDYTQTSSSGSMTSIATGSFSNSALSLTSISQAYKTLMLIISDAAGNNVDMQFRLNADTGSNYAWVNLQAQDAANNRSTGSTSFQVSYPYLGNTYADNTFVLTLQNYTDTTSYKPLQCMYSGTGTSNTKAFAWSVGTYASVTAITGISTANSLVSGSYILYGVN
jgi:hypothetical protein